MNVQTSETDRGDVDGLPRRVMKGRMKVELVESNERCNRRFRDWNLNALYLSWRPDPKALAFTPDAPLAAQRVAEGEMKAVEFDVRVETFRQGLDDLLAHKRLSTMSEDLHDNYHRDEKRKYTTADPIRPARSAPRHAFIPPLLHPSTWMPLDTHTAGFSA